MQEQKRILDPTDRSSEILFGLIMALTFTCSVSVATSTRNDVMTMLASALSCNLAWGVVDAAMFVLNSVIARQKERGLATALRDSSDGRSREIILENLPAGVADALAPSDLDRIAGAIRAKVVPALGLAPNREDLLGGVAVFLLVFLSTVPGAVPFLVISDVSSALRVSNAIAVLMLFVVGSKLARHIHWRPHWLVGLGVALFGAILVATTIALGG